MKRKFVIALAVLAVVAMGVGSVAAWWPRSKPLIVSQAFYQKHYPYFAPPPFTVESNVWWQKLPGELIDGWEYYWVDEEIVCTGKVRFWILDKPEHSYMLHYRVFWSGEWIEGGDIPRPIGGPGWIPPDPTKVVCLDGWFVICEGTGCFEKMIGSGKILVEWDYIEEYWVAYSFGEAWGAPWKPPK